MKIIVRSNVAKNITLLLYLLIVVLLAAATVVESHLGTEYVLKNIYGAWWFVALWGLLAALSIGAIWRFRLWQRISVLLLHSSFITILLGALVTYLWSEKGYIRLNQGEQISSYIGESKETVDLPFSIELLSFEVEHYTGTTSPSDYISHIRIDNEREESVSMNRIVKVGGYRLYQSSYNDKEGWSLLSLNYDPIGIAITYLGYLLLAISMVMTLLSKRCGFVQLLHHPILRNKTVAILALMTLSITDSEARPVVARIDADSIASIAIVYNGRVAPFNTMANDVVTKIYGDKEYNNLSAEQVVGSWILYPMEWKDEPFIKVDSKLLRDRLGVKSDYISLQDLYDGEGYELQSLWNEVKDDPKSQLKKEVSKLDEKVSILTMLRNGSLFTKATEGVDERKIKAELLYNRIDSVGMLFKIHLTLGLLAFFIYLYSLIKDKKIRFFKSLMAVQIIHSFCFLTLNLGVRWYVKGSIPMSNGYEMMLLVAWVILGTALATYRRSTIIPVAALILSGFVLLVSSLSSHNPQITSLMPVLSSPWLSSHVSLIMISYALFFFMAFNGLTALILRRTMYDSSDAILKLQVISQILLYPALFALTAGIFIGAIWANVSWGRYWAWDPKEVWALITMLIYAIPLHSRTIVLLGKPIAFHIYVIFAFLAVLMTYFGVNFLLGGMHSYANS